MALAKLCVMVRQDDLARNQNNFQFQAFIVDHQARKGSREEAQLVRETLRRMGMRRMSFDDIPRLILNRHACDDFAPKVAIQYKSIGTSGF